MSDLISREDAISVVRDIVVNSDELVKALESLPIAFNKEKVYKELAHEQHLHCNNSKKYLNEGIYHRHIEEKWMAVALVDAIEIFIRGGK